MLDHELLLLENRDDGEVFTEVKSGDALEDHMCLGRLVGRVDWVREEDSKLRLQRNVVELLIEDN